MSSESLLRARGALRRFVRAYAPFLDQRSDAELEADDERIEAEPAPAEKARTVAVGALFYAAVYGLASLLLPLLPGFAQLPESTRLDLCARVLSTANALMVSQGALRFLLVYGQRKQCLLDPLEGTSRFASWHIAWGAGYFLVDTVVLLRNFRKTGSLQLNRQSLVHHLVGLVGGLASLAFRWATFLVFARGITELSVPFLNLRAVFELSEAWRSSRLALLNELAFAFLFVAVRISTIPYFWWIGAAAYRAGRFRTHFVIRWLLFFCGVALDALNLLWSWVIFRKAVRRLKGGAPR